MTLLRGRQGALVPERVTFTLTLFQAINNVWIGLSSVDPASFVKVDVYHSPPFGRYIDASLSTLVGPPIEPHEEILIREDMAKLN
ncbi:hypothetical protein EMIT0215P_30296 [Pseudomonas serboccidentalis]